MIWSLAHTGTVLQAYTDSDRRSVLPYSTPVWPAGRGRRPLNGIPRTPVLPWVTLPVSGRLPRQADLTGLESGSSYRLSLTVTDGNTVPVSAGAEFIYQGETHLVINNPSHAAIATPAAVECDRPEGGVVTLDGSASEDIDSSPGTHDDIASYEWLEDAGLPAERILGTGPVLAVTLPLGAHRVTLRVTDIYGETDLGNTTITVQDTAPPLLSCPQVEPSECAGPEGTEVSLVAAATDVCGAAPRVTNSRNGNGADASGDYPLGTTSVTFTATDAAGNIATCAVPVTVRDTQPSVLTLPAALTVDATTPAGAVVTYAASARDTCAGSVMAVCTPPSGSTFPINAPGQVTMVACKATDGAHNGTTGSFTVHVAGAAEQLEALRAVLESFHFHGGLANDLDNKLNEALKELGKGKPDHACKKLEEFSKKVTQESTKKKPKITPGQASTMMTAARRIGGVLGCGAGP